MNTYLKPWSAKPVKEQIRSDRYGSMLRFRHRDRGVQIGRTRTR